MPHADPEIRRAFARDWWKKNAGRLRPIRAEQARTARKKNPGRDRKYNIKAKYGLSVDQYWHMFVRQGGVCAICGRPPKTRHLNIDHDHKTNRIRGLLCWWCNSHVVTKNVSADHLRKAADYLDSTFDGRNI